jgi:hypothetical protein
MLFFLASCADEYYMEGRVKTISATRITEQSVMLEGSVELILIGERTQPNITSRGFVLKTLGRPDKIVMDNVGREGHFRSDATNLVPNTTYSVQAFATIGYYNDYNDNHEGTFYGNIIEFKTLDGKVAPIVTTQNASNITLNGAMLNGTIVFEGYPAYEERGFVYNTNSTLTIGSAGVLKRMALGRDVGSFSETLTGLESGTSYYFRTYVINRDGTVYGETLRFSTLQPSAPQVFTLPVSNVTTNSATFNGRIDNPGEPPFHERGFVYSTRSMPEIGAAGTFPKRMIDLTGNFTATITGLVDTTYYVRAYAINSQGTSYSTNEVMFRPTGTTDFVVLQADGIMVQANDIRSGATWSEATSACSASRVGGFNNWRLPTSGELTVLYNRRTEIGGFAAASYWSSSLGNWGNERSTRNFSTGSTSSSWDGSSLRARCVRNLP